MLPSLSRRMRLHQVLPHDDYGHARPNDCFRLMKSQTHEAKILGYAFGYVETKNAP
jgi:hypothetical protein